MGGGNYDAQIISCIGRESDRVYRVAGQNSTTEPPMLESTGRDILFNQIFFSVCASLSLCWFFSACVVLSANSLCARKRSRRSACFRVICTYLFTNPYSFLARLYPNLRLIPTPCYENCSLKVFFGGK